MTAKTIYLSPPNVGSEELKKLGQVMEGGWIAPVGPELQLFEEKLNSLTKEQKVLALNSGTSALHLALILSDISKGDDVVIGSFTFAACANVVRYQQATPIFMDSENETWNLDPVLLSEYLSNAKKLPKAVIVTHLYGVPAKIDDIKIICDNYDITLIEDAAEALGSTYKNQQAGSFGSKGIISFNGNKIITTSGGGALIGSETDYRRGLHLSTQANNSKFGYDHSEVGYNYRMSNLLAGVGLAQLEKLNQFISRKREIAKHYEAKLDSEVFEFPAEPENAFCNRWLTTPLIKKEFAGKIKPLDLIKFLDENSVESRLLWKPLHLHQVNHDNTYYGGSVAEQLFERGLCLPSGSSMSNTDLEVVTGLIEKFLKSI